MHELLHILEHSILDSLKALPFLFLVYLLIEFIEHKHPEKLSNALRKMGPFGAVGGAVLGCVPQCGFSVAASNLYSGRLITVGTLIAVFISTSDEALPLIIAEPAMIGTVWKLILAKVIIAVIVGLGCDFVIRAMGRKSNIDLQSEHCELCDDSGCDCEHHGIFRSAIHHTLSIFVFIFIINLVLTGAIELLGEESLEKLLLTDSVFQPFIAALIGFIPNCAASIVLTELYIAGGISFGSLIGGLCTGAGVGIMVLFRTNKNLKANLAIVAVLYLTGALSGVIINLVN